MKELSTEEKAKRYDEVVAMAKECITYVPDEAVNKYMLDMFPELKESEDERIKKQIISFLKEFEHDHYRSLDFSSWIDWLEKQGNNADKVKQQQAIEIPFGAKDSELQESTYYIPEGYHAEINGNAVVIKKGELINDTPSQDHWQDLRERAAIAAMHAFCVSPSSYTGNISLDKMAQHVVKIADALVKELKGE